MAKAGCSFGVRLDHLFAFFCRPNRAWKGEYARKVGIQRCWDRQECKITPVHDSKKGLEVNHWLCLFIPKMFCICNEFLVSANSEDGTVIIWNSKGKEEAKFERIHQSIVWVLQGKKHLCVSAGEDRKINGIMPLAD